jgi:hypothetical protein
VCEIYTSKCPLLTSSRIVFLINDTNAIWEGIFESAEEEEDERKRKTQDGRIRFDYSILMMDRRNLNLNQFDSIDLI